MTRRHPLTVWRKSQHLSMAAFARQVGVTREAVRQWENGASKPHFLKVRAIEKATGGSIRATHFYGAA